MTPLGGLVALALAATPPPDGRPPAPPRADSAATQDVIFLGENRPIFLRLRMKLGDRPFRAAWMDSVKEMHRFLDRDGDGVVTRDEADKGGLAALVRVANGGATAMPRGDLDARPKDGRVSLDELADALQAALGPFRVEAGKLAGGKADALFERLDRDGDGKLARAELDATPATLGKLDLDDDELIDGAEVDPFADPSTVQDEDAPGRRGRLAAGPPVLDLSPDESTLRPVRLLLKRYDKGGDNKLSRAEFAVDPKAFAKADADADAGLDTEELRRFLAAVAPDVELEVAFSADASGRATIAAGPRPLPAWAKVRALDGGDVEVSADEVRLEVHVDDGADAGAAARRTFLAQFGAADADNNDYVEKSEVTKDKDHPSPLAGLFDLMDRDGDGKLYRKEVEDFVDRQARAARDRMVLTASDQGRAIFSILDLDRDRRLGLREVRATAARVATWDRDGDGRVAADEIPHHYQLSLARGQLGGSGGHGAGAAGPMAADPPRPAAAGPSWFRRMDRNRDGDLSAREFRGPKAQFDRLDRDRDGLIDPAEAEAAAATASAGRPGPTPAGP